MRKIIFGAAIAGLVLITFTACGKKSEANKEQIENARQDAEEMTKGYDPNKSMKPTSGTAAPVVYDTTPVTEIIVTEEPASAQ